MDNPDRDAKENVSFRFVAKIPEDTPVYLSTNTKSRGGEKDEVSEFVWLNKESISKMDPSEFAFDHDKMILELKN